MRRMLRIREKEYESIMAIELKRMQAELVRQVRDKGITTTSISRGTRLSFNCVKKFLNLSGIPAYRTISRVRYYIERIKEDGS